MSSNQRNAAKPVYTLALLLSLYLAQGLPIGFITQALPVILREYNASLTLIGWSGLLLLPWAFKFLWAPLVDRVFHAGFGQSKSWIVPMQLLAAMLLVFVAWVSPNAINDNAELAKLFLLLFLISLFGASQDIASDALATRTLARDERGLGNAAQVTGYRLGLIFGGGLFLIILDTLTWRTSFLLMAGFVLTNTIPIILHREPHWEKPTHSQTHLSVCQWFKSQFGYFWSTREMRAWLAVLLTFKMTDGMSSGMVKPMMKDMGLSLSDIGFYASILGSLASAFGAVAAGMFMKKISRFQALFWFLLAQIVATLLYAVVGWYFETGNMLAVWTIYAANAIEHAAAAMALVAMLSVIMDYARADKAGSDFTFQVCLLASLSGSAHILSGYIATSLGYTGLYVASVLAGFVLLAPLIVWHLITTANKNTNESI